MIKIKYCIFSILIFMYSCSNKTTIQDSPMTKDTIIPSSYANNNYMNIDSIFGDSINDSNVFSKIILPKSHTLIHGVNKKIPKDMREEPNTRKSKNLSLKTTDEIKKIFGSPIRSNIQIYRTTDTITDLNLRTLLSKIHNPLLMEADYGDYKSSWYKIYYLRENGIFKSLYARYISVSSGDSVWIKKYVLVDQEDIPQK